MSAFAREIIAEFERAIEGLEWEDVVSTLQGTIDNLLADKPNPPSTPPPPTSPPVSARLEVNTLHEPAESLDGGYGWSVPLGAAHQTTVAPYVHSQPVYSQVQYINVPLLTLSDGFNQSLHPVVVLNGGVLFEMPALAVAPNVFAAPQTTDTFSSNAKRQPVNQQPQDGPYIKKPPNAFMLYMKEQRQNVALEIRMKGNAAVSTHLGEMWRSLTQEQQAKYYEQADEEKRLHKQTYPDWTPRANYGMKKKRQRNRAASRAQDEVKRLCVPLQTPVTGASTSLTGDTEAPHAEAEPKLQANVQTTETVPANNLLCSAPPQLHSSPATFFL